MTDEPIHPTTDGLYYRGADSYCVLGVEDGVVRMERKIGDTAREVTETVERFVSEVESGRVIHHPPCAYCGLSYDPADHGDHGEPLHYECWYQLASVVERCEAEADRPGGMDRLATEALRSGDPTAFLLGVLGDPARPLYDRCDAERLLSGAVSSGEIVNAQVRCPECYEGEAFRMDPETGAVSCHCGHVLKAGEGAGDG